MGPDAGEGVEHGGPLLNAEPFNSVRIVGAPDLGAVVEHARIEAPAAAAAVFQQQVRELVHNPLLEAVQRQHIPVRLLRAAEICQRPVHIPLQIGDGGAVQRAGNALPDVLLHLRAAQIQHQLVPAQHGPPLSGLDGPVRVLPVKGAVLGNHFRLHPDAKF